MLPREIRRQEAAPPRTPDNGPAPRLSLPASSADDMPAPAPLPRPMPLPPALAKPVTLRGLAQALRRQWVLALSAGVAVGVVAGCVAYALLPAARAGARAGIHVGPADSGGIPARVKSRTVLDAALERPEVKGLSLLAGRPEPQEFLRGGLV